MKEIRPLRFLPLCCLLLAVLPFVAQAKSKPRDHAEMRAFRLENPCPSTGLRQDACPGWHVGYITPLCANGADRQDNMRWMTQEDKRFAKAATGGKDCRKPRSKSSSTLP